MKEAAFKEVQKLNKVGWLMFIVGAIAAFMWVGFVQQIILGQPFGTNPAPNWMMWLLLLLFGMGLPVVWFITKLIIEIKQDHILIRYYPFVTRQIPFSEIEQHQARTYNAIKEYGGWGMRGWGNKRAYNVSGNEGVELKLYSGQTIILGSKNAKELALALDSAMQK